MKRRQHQRSAYTLIGLSLVIPIIAIMVGMVLGVSAHEQRNASINSAQTDIKCMGLILDRYKLDEGSYPTGAGAGGSSVGLHAALSKYMGFSAEQISGDKIIDPWGHEYRYRSPGSHNPTGFDLWSCGPDGASSSSGTQADDITNW